VFAVVETASAPVGASLLAKAFCQMTFVSLTRRFREQARSHIGFCVEA